MTGQVTIASIFARTAFASSLSIAVASAPAIGPAIMKGRCRLIASTPMTRYAT